MSEKTILRLHANGDVETFVPLYQDKNLYVIRDSEPGQLNSRNSQIIPQSNGTRTSDFIPVEPNEIYTISVYWSQQSSYKWVMYHCYDINYEFLYYGQLDNYPNLEFVNQIPIPSDVVYLRVSATQLENDDCKIQLEKGNVVTPYFPSFTDRGLNNLNPYSFNKKEILIPKIVEYPPNREDLDLPTWAKDTGNPISIFPEGIVIKGNLIEKQEIIFYDDFNRPNTSSGLGGNWLITSGDYHIQNNTAQPTNLAINNIAVVDVGTQNNISIELGVIVPNVSESLIFRYQDDANYLQVIFELNDIHVRKRENGVNTNLYSKTYGTIWRTSYKMKVELRGTEIKVFINDILEITTDSNYLLNTTKCGMKAWSYNEHIGWFDNFEVRRLI